MIISFILVLVLALLITQVNDTVLNPGFYNDQMQQADVYNFLYDELLPVALDEAEVPPEWLQYQVESATNSIIPYFLGDTDEFTYTLVLKDRAEKAAEVIKEDILKGHAFESIYDDGMSYLADKLLENLPYSPTFGKEEIENSLRRVVPLGEVEEDWITPQVEAAIDSVMPYMTRERDEFTITVHLRDQVDTAAEAAIDLFSEPSTYDYLRDEMITPIVVEKLGSIVNLPFEVSLTQEEIASAIKEVFPDAWVEARLSELINGIASYAKGETDSIEVTVDLADRKPVALDALAELADDRLQTLFNSLPTCSEAEFLQIVQNLPPGTLPGCRPSNRSYQEFKIALNINIADSIDQVIGDHIPDQWHYTDADLRQSIGENNEDFLDKARDWASEEGWTFTKDDLLKELDDEEEETLEDVRGWIESGYTLTQTDLREEISDREEDLDAFDTARNWIGIGRTWLWTLWLLPFISLIFIGLSGGRNWRSRLAWMVVVLLLTSLAIHIATWQTYSNIGEPGLEEIMPNPLEYEGVERLMLEKGNEMIENASSSFVSGIQRKTLYMMIGSGVILLGVIGWSVVSSRRTRRESTENTTERTRGA